MINKNKLPENWILCQLKDIGQIVSGGTPSTKEISFWGDEIAWITPADLSGYTEKYISKGRKSISEKGLQNSSARVIPKGSVLFSSRAPIGYVAIAANSLSTNQGFKNVVPYTGINSIYLYYYLKSIKELAVKNASGTTFKEISGSKFSELPFLLPPLAEQEHIIDKIEELFSELDAGLESLKTAQAQLEIYRQAVLKYAFEEGKENYQPCLLDDISEKIQIGPFGSQLHREDYIENGVPLINPTHIKNGKIVADNSFTITIEKRDSLQNYILQTGDIIMGRRGEMARCGLVTDKENGWFCGTGSLYFRPKLNLVDSKFLYNYLSSNPVKKYLEENAGGTTMANLNGKIVKNIPILLPSIEEQQRIVEEIENRLSICDKLEETINQSRIQAESLRQSILKQAFEGNLVSQNITDEPASVLLERIKQERESFLEAERQFKKQTPRKTKSKTMAEVLKNILQLLKEKDEPVHTHSLWQSSKHKDDIDEFYAEVKELLDKGEIEEIRDGKESFLALAASK